MVMIFNNQESPIRIAVYDKENPIRELAMMWFWKEYIDFDTKIDTHTHTTFRLAKDIINSSASALN